MIGKLLLIAYRIVETWWRYMPKFIKAILGWVVLRVVQWLADLEDRRS